MANKQSKTSDCENLGKMLVSIYESGYIDHKQTYKQSFLKGLMSGLGGVIGATIVVAALLWILSVFKQVPLIGPFTDRVRLTVEEKK